MSNVKNIVDRKKKKQSERETLLRVVGRLIIHKIYNRF